MKQRLIAAIWILATGAGRAWAESPAPGLAWGVGVYGSHVAAAGELDRARWDWQFIRFSGGLAPPESMARYNRYLEINPRQRLVVELNPVEDVGAVDKKATFLDFHFRPQVRREILRRTRAQVRSVLDQISKPENVVAFMFTEEMPGSSWGHGAERSAYDPEREPHPVVEHYRDAIAEERGEPFARDEAHWRWAGRTFVGTLEVIHRAIKEEAPDKPLFYWHVEMCNTLDMDPHLGDKPDPHAYAYRYTDIIREGLCDGLVAYVSDAESWESKYMRFVRKHGWPFFSQLSHPGWMRRTGWPEAWKLANTPVPENLGYFVFCENCARESRYRDDRVLRWESGLAHRFVQAVRTPDHGIVVRVQHDTDHPRLGSYVVAGYTDANRSRVEPGTSYRWSVKLKMDDVQGTKGALLTIVWWPEQGSPVRQETVFIRQGSCEWQTMSGEVIAPPKTDYCRLYLGMGAATGTAWFDELSFKRSGSEEELLSNGDFEEAGFDPPTFSGWRIEDDAALRSHWRHICDENRIGVDVVERYHRP